MSEYMITKDAIDAIHQLYVNTAIDAGLSLPLPPLTSDVEEILEKFGNEIVNLVNN